MPSSVEWGSVNPMHRPGIKPSRQDIPTHSDVPGRELWDWK